MIGPAFSVMLQLRDQPKRELFLDERCVHRDAYPARTTSICNHLERPKANFISPFDMLFFSVPQTALDEIADDWGVQRIDNLSCERCLLDETVWHFGQALLPALESPREVGSMYAEHALFAATTYFACAFGGMREISHPKRGGLAPWQLQRATETMMASLRDNIGLSQIADECRLSVGYFVRAFKRSTGVPPHRWLLRQRVERAKTFLRSSRMTLTEIAIECGFSDQTHFTRVFTGHVGMTPGSWRRGISN